MGDSLDDLFTAIHNFLQSTVHAAGPWAVPMVLSVAGLIAMANKGRLVSGFGVFLVLITAGCVVVILAFQQGRI